MSSVRLIFNGRTSSKPILRAAASTSAISNIPVPASALASNASRMSRKCSRRLTPRSRAWREPGDVSAWSR